MASGLATDNPWGDRQESQSRAELAEWLRSGLRLVFPPGGSYEYSNLGYAFLGEVITRLSGQDYREFVRERIIDPLGLRDTRFSVDDLEAVANGYHREPALPGQRGGWTAQEPTGPGAFSPIGGLYSSVRDLAAWAGLYLTREVPAGASFTAADLLEAQQPLNNVSTGAAEAPLRGHVTRAYGYGLSIEAFTDHGTVVAHSGGYPGFTAYMCWHTESGFTVISSANGTHSGSAGPARRMLLPLVAAATSKPSLVGAVSRPTTIAAPAASTAHASPAPASPAPASGAAITPPTWPETLAAAARLEDLVREVPTAGADDLAARYADLFAENVEMDFPLARRVEYLEQALVNIGRLRPAEANRVPTSERPSRARWSMPAEFGRLEVSIELMPVAPFKVQTFSVEVVNGWSRVDLF
jgi:hypothetical protein